MIGPAPQPTAPSPLVAWRRIRRCQNCGRAITAGPFEVCSQNHRSELSANDVIWPVDPRWRYLYERGYWLRWFFGAGTVVLLVISMAFTLFALVGALNVTVALGCSLVCSLLAIVALLLAPQVAKLPTSTRIDRQVRADATNV